MESILQWKNAEVVDFLRSHRMDALSGPFEEHGVTGKDLLSLTSEELRDDLNVPSLHLRKKLLRRIDKLRLVQNQAVAAGSTSVPK